MYDGNSGDKNGQDELQYVNCFGSCFMASTAGFFILKNYERLFLLIALLDGSQVCFHQQALSDTAASGCKKLTSLLSNLLLNFSSIQLSSTPILA